MLEGFHDELRGGIDVEQAARLFLRFLDLSRDVERNRADSVDRETNVISYVMDAGIVEVFLNARDRRGGRQVCTVRSGASARLCRVTGGTMRRRPLW